jgi:hypothetical protein
MPCRLALATPKQKSAIPKPLRVRQHSAHSGPSNPNEPLLGSDRIPRTMRPPLGGASFRKLPADAATDKSTTDPHSLSLCSALLSAIRVICGLLFRGDDNRW